MATIVGKGRTMHKSYQLIDAIRDSASPVLLMGETGTGKEVIAHATHTIIALAKMGLLWW